MGTLAVTFVVTYYLSAIVQTVSHRLFGHTKRVMAIYAEHTHGHHARYARSDLLRDDWVPSERHVLWYFAVSFSAIAGLVWAMAPFAVFLAYLAGLAFSFAPAPRAAPPVPHSRQHFGALRMVPAEAGTPLHSPPQGAQQLRDRRELDRPGSRDLSGDATGPGIRRQ